MPHEMHNAFSVISELSENSRANSCRQKVENIGIPDMIHPSEMKEAECN